MRGVISFLVNPNKSVSWVQEKRFPELGATVVWVDSYGVPRHIAVPSQIGEPMFAENWQVV